MSSDFIEDFCETNMFSAHLDLLFFLTHIDDQNITKIRKKIDVNEHLISFYCGLLVNP
ncbi:hypothetical protein HanXRQr2_Chr01g0019961 [Helianthus annuus]|uniref:Uncharacterized protein n=1 Tax=Helianthus annuus TaxID=4232 RepID=A0A9K3JWJ6_HELAN|nr:hypothetical protein HanXRQr2_Chr01g0019961 [Helianthus annuus]